LQTLVVEAGIASGALSDGLNAGGKVEEHRNGVSQVLVSAQQIVLAGQDIGSAVMKTIQ
jgi:hypothetical protein